MVSAMEDGVTEWVCLVVMDMVVSDAALDMVAGWESNSVTRKPLQFLRRTPAIA